MLIHGLLWLQIKWVNKLLFCLNPAFAMFYNMFDWKEEFYWNVLKCFVAGKTSGNSKASNYKSIDFFH